MSTGLLISTALLCTAIGFAMGAGACARADTAGPGDPGVAPCMLSINWTTQRQPPAVYAAEAKNDLLPRSEGSGPAISVTTLPPGGGGETPPAPVSLGAAATYAGLGLGALGALGWRRWRRA